MTFEWDPAKSTRNWQQRGFDFAFASLVLLSTTIRAATTASGVWSRWASRMGFPSLSCLPIAWTRMVASFVA